MTSALRSCPACAATSPAEARFCMSCGARLSAPAGAEERRRVTVLFADLSGYTAVAERMDPEQVKRLVDRALMRLKDEVDRHGGTVDKFIGDNVMALFGAPLAHEDDPERAVRAGLGMQAAMGEINDALRDTHGVALTLRVGINTGVVIAGAVGDSYTVIGDAVNVAARLQSAGRKGGVTVGEDTYAATRHAIEYTPLAPMQLKGREQAVLAWEALPVLEAPAGRPQHDSSPLVGRDAELEALQGAFAGVVRDRRPHLVGILGEPGVGKSRLVREARRRLVSDGPRFRTARCPPYGSGGVYGPIADVLTAEAGIGDDEGREAAAARLRRHVHGVLVGQGRPEAEAEHRAATVAQVLGFAEAHDGADPERVRDEFTDTVRDVVRALAGTRGLVLIFDDLQWADEAVLDLVASLTTIPDTLLLVVVLARRELLDRRPTLAGGPDLQSLHVLDPLTADDTRALALALLGEDRRDLAAKLSERSGGNPLFLEELALHLRDDPTDGRELPATVHGVLAARLDGLAPAARQLLGHAAVVGTSFWTESVAAEAVAAGCDLAETLRGLEESGTLVPVRVERPGDPDLAFKHVLVRDAAYERLPRAVRARKHAEIGAFLEERAGSRRDEVASLLARHYTTAVRLGRDGALPADQLTRISAQAFAWLETAVDAAAGVSANDEVLQQLADAADLDLSAAERARVAERRGDALRRVGDIDLAVDAWNEALAHHTDQDDAPAAARLLRKLGAGLARAGRRREAIAHLQRGIGALRDVDDGPGLVRLYEETATVYLQSGDTMLAVYAAEKALALAGPLGNAVAASRAYGVFGLVFGRLGDLDKAREHLERSVELARGFDDASIVALLALGRHLDETASAPRAGAAAYARALELATVAGDVAGQVGARAGLAQMAIAQADWPAVEAHCRACHDLHGATAATGRAALTLELEGYLAWRAGDLRAARERFERAHAHAHEAGWTDREDSALRGLALVLRDGGDLTGAAEAFARAADACGRAGMLSRRVQAECSRAVVLALAGDAAAAQEAVTGAQRVAGDLRDPIAPLALREAAAVVAAPAEGGPALRAVARQWTELGRPLDAARCGWLADRVLASG